MKTLDIILFEKHLILKNKNIEDSNNGYYCAYLLINFGIEFTNPKMVDQSVVKKVQEYLNLDVPASFYTNPQDMTLFSTDKLRLEQIVSYCLGYGTSMGRVELFKRELKQYVVGNEVKLRSFTIIDWDQATACFNEVVKNYCSYKRPFSIEEKERFQYLYRRGYYQGDAIECKDNIFALLDTDISLAKQLDMKDIVKLSISLFGESKTINSVKKKGESLELLKEATALAKDCPLSRTQAKKYNKVCQMCDIEGKKVNNNNSPYRLANVELSKGNVLEAAHIFAQNGSLLERNFRYLISRSNLAQMRQIVSLLDNKNVAVLIQMLEAFKVNEKFERRFTFYKNNLMKYHSESYYEARWRKTRLNNTKNMYIRRKLFKLIDKHFQSLKSLGRIYVSPEFKKVSVPLNTTASGSGLDVLPTGSRTKIKGDYIRTFVNWKKAYDIDSSLILVNENGFLEEVGFWNYNYKPYGHSILSSGNITGPNGTEYYDIKLSELKERGFTMVIQVFNGYYSTLNEGEIKCGYFDKTNLRTKAWDPKNIDFQINVKATTRSFIGFAIDLETNEVITLNLARRSDSRILSTSDYESIKKYLDRSYLDMNMYEVLKNMGTLEEEIDNADCIFDSSYIARDDRRITRPWDRDALIGLVSGKGIR